MDASLKIEFTIDTSKHNDADYFRRWYHESFLNFESAEWHDWSDARKLFVARKSSFVLDGEITYDVPAAIKRIDPEFYDRYRSIIVVDHNAALLNMINETSSRIYENIKRGQPQVMFVSPSVAELLRIYRAKI